MNLLEMLLASQNGNAVNEVAKNFGLGQDQTQGVIEQVLPMLAKGMKNNASQPGGLESLLGALSGGGHEQFLDKPEILGQQSTTTTGNAILGHILGSKDVSRNVAAHASTNTGVSSSIIKKMLPVIASMAMGALSKNAGSTGMLGQGRASATSGNSSPMDMLGSLLDMDKDGSIADDILGLAKKFF